MNVKEILVNWLKKHKYDGLYLDYPGGETCECFLDDLIPCDNLSGKCTAGIKIESEECEKFYIGPRKEKDPDEICSELNCSGFDDNCPGNPVCPAVIFSQENPVECDEAANYMKQQIYFTRRCSFCHGENKEECSHCNGSGIEPGKS